MPATKLTYREYARLPDDGLRYDILDGEVVVSSNPGSFHQGLQAELGCELVGRVYRTGRGRVFGSLDCELLPHDIVRPDLLVVLPSHYRRITNSRIRGTPDLVIEILTPGTAARDRHEKRRRYEAAGTPELWLVDGARRSVLQFVHDGARLQLVRTATRRLSPAILPDVVIPLTWTW
ncbi:MAG: Uma2 family endonuclease [Planctomycetota bacterium]